MNTLFTYQGNTEDFKQLNSIQKTGYYLKETFLICSSVGLSALATAGLIGGGVTISWFNRLAH